MAQQERRRHPRQVTRLGVSMYPAEPGNTTIGRTVDVAAGGLRCLLSGREPQVGDQVRMEVAIPAGHGHWPHAGTVSGQGTILRCEPASEDVRSDWAAAIRFDQPLELQFA